MPASSEGWGVAEYLLADVYQAFSGQPHPARPTVNDAKTKHSDRVARLRAQRERLGVSAP
ncbi:hypothetical protein [Pseudoclavibacter sp. RFBA6]|uniref:hypothetical protein n=1 Tax=Pseudoclavibacter sp. RFBA6 TaxID=2080573 RepID=UPI001CA519EE|nr:hypothetical protein [Pseudoclavibacter sp. RFBA6]